MSSYTYPFVIPAQWGTFLERKARNLMKLRLYPLVFKKLSDACTSLDYAV